MGVAIFGAIANNVLASSQSPAAITSALAVVIAAVVIVALASLVAAVFIPPTPFVGAGSSRCRIRLVE